MEDQSTTGPEDGPKPADADRHEVQIGFELRGWCEGRFQGLKPGLLVALGYLAPEFQQWVQHLHR